MCETSSVRNADLEVGIWILVNVYVWICIWALLIILKGVTKEVACMKGFACSVSRKGYASVEGSEGLKCVSVCVNLNYGCGS